jgi:hypothetical protein
MYLPEMVDTNQQAGNRQAPTIGTCVDISIIMDFNYCYIPKPAIAQLAEGRIVLLDIFKR